MNAIRVIQPYWSSGTWVFDDERAGLVREPFVCGIPQMIDRLVTDIPDARKGFRLLFSSHPFPGHQAAFHRTRAESGGTWYRLEEPPMEGWLCPPSSSISMKRRRSSTPKPSRSHHKGSVAVPFHSSLPML